MKCLSIPMVQTAQLVRGLSDWASAHGAVWDPLAGTASGVVCLDSSLLCDDLGRWTIAAARPLKTIRPHNGDAFAAAGRLLGPRREVQETTGLPFAGGIIGLWGYGCRASAEELAWDDPVYGAPHAWWGYYDTFVAIDNAHKRAAVYSWGLTAPEAEPDDRLAAHRLQEVAGFVANAQGVAPATPPPCFAPAVGQQWHGEAIDAVMEDIQNGEYYQACLTYPMQAPREGRTAYDVFLHLRRLTPAPFAAFLATGTPMAIAGASPERFLQVRQGVATARPMKGTRPRGATPEEDAHLVHDLLYSEKDRAENVMIVDLMRNDLGRVCEIGSVQVPALFTVESYATVHQLTSKVIGRLRQEVPAWQLARACFPPGSMTGAPKIRAMQRLASIEPGPRGWYAGALGYLDVRGEMDLSVIIRSALVGQDEVRWHVGGGIVADSTASGEWQESLDKCPGALRTGQGN